MKFEDIKYRAWHKERKVMFPVSEIDFNKKRIKGMSEGGVIVARFDEVEIMPWVFIYDNAGKPVYEDDIISLYSKHYNDSAEFVVCIDNGWTYAKNLDTPNYVLDINAYFYDDDESYEVVGNIWERTK